MWLCNTGCHHFGQVCWTQIFSVFSEKYTFKSRRQAAAARPQPQLFHISGNLFAISIPVPYKTTARRCLAHHKRRKQKSAQFIHKSRCKVELCVGLFLGLARPSWSLSWFPGKLHNDVKTWPIKHETSCRSSVFETNKDVLAVSPLHCTNLRWARLG